MVVTQVRALVSKPVHKIFEYIRNFENLPYYNSSVVKATWTDSNKLVCRIKISLSILSFESEYKIIEIVENQKIVSRCETSFLEFEDSYIVEKLGSQTRIIITDRIQLKSFLTLSESILKPNMKQEMEANMQKLKSILENL